MTKNEELAGTALQMFLSLVEEMSNEELVEAVKMLIKANEELRLTIKQKLGVDVIN